MWTQDFSVCMVGGPAELCHSGGHPELMLEQRLKKVEHTNLGLFGHRSRRAAGHPPPPFPCWPARQICLAGLSQVGLCRGASPSTEAQSASSEE